MTPNAKRRGFARQEIVIGIVLIALLAGTAFLYFRPKEDFRERAKRAAVQAKVIHGWLASYANDHGGEFPKGTSANAAYRELFKMNLGADEKQFYIPGDRYHISTPHGMPDGDIGREPDYVQALEPGENAFAYVSGLTTADTARLPLIANGFTSQPGIWSKNKNEKGGVFQGHYGVVCRVGGSAVVHTLKDGEWSVQEMNSGKMMNIFTPGFDDANFTVLDPQ